MRGWLWRHPIAVSIGTLWLLALVAAVAIGAWLPDTPRGGGCVMGPDCAQSPESQFRWALTLGAGPAAMALTLLGIGLGVLLRKPFSQRAERRAEGAPSGR